MGKFHGSKQEQEGTSTPSGKDRPGTGGRSEQENVETDTPGTGTSRGSTLSASLWKVVKAENMGLKLLPNIRDFRISLAGRNELFEQIGINVKETPRLKFEPWRNKGANRFVVWQYLRLKKYRSNPELYWKIA